MKNFLASILVGSFLLSPSFGYAESESCNNSWKKIVKNADEITDLTLAAYLTIQHEYSLNQNNVELKALLDAAEKFNDEWSNDYMDDQLDEVIGDAEKEDCTNAAKYMPAKSFDAVKELVKSEGSSGVKLLFKFIDKRYTKLKKHLKSF